jgi:hypothetical protein
MPRLAPVIKSVFPFRVDIEAPPAVEDFIPLLLLRTRDALDDLPRLLPPPEPESQPQGSKRDEESPEQEPRRHPELLERSPCGNDDDEVLDPFPEQVRFPDLRGNRESAARISAETAKARVKRPARTPSQIPNPMITMAMKRLGRKLTSSSRSISIVVNPRACAAVPEKARMTIQKTIAPTRSKRG